MAVKIDAWYYGNIDAPNGVATFLKYFKRKFDERADVEFHINSLTSNEGGTGGQNERYTIKNRLKIYLKGKIMYLAKFSPKIAYYFLDKAFVKNAERVVETCEKSAENVILFFQDFFTSSAYFEKYPNTENKSVLVLHGDGIPLKMILQTYPFLEKSNKITDLLSHKLSNAILNVTRIVFLSNKAKNNFCKIYPQYEGKCSVIYNGLDDTTLMGLKPIYPRLDNGVINLVSVGTVGTRKGFDLLVESFLSLPNQIQSTLKLNLIGDGPLLNELSQKCKRNPSIEFWGNRNDVDKLLASMDVFVLVSRDEGMPMAVIEAMRQGKPLFLSDVGGMAEMVKEGYNGWLVQPDVLSIKDGLLRLANQKENLESFSKNSRRDFLSTFLGGIMLDRYYGLFKSIDGKG